MYIYVETNKQINKFCLKEGMIGISKYVNKNMAQWIKAELLYKYL